MPNRREFLQIGIAASTLPFAAQAARAAGIAAAPSPDSQALALYKVVYDSRFAASVAFARRAQSLGMAVQGIAGDMTRFWYEDLHGRWQQGAAAIAGLTAHGPLFCLERLAWDQGMRVVFRAEHKVDGAGYLQHALSGPVTMLDASTLSAREQWSERMADIVTRCPSGRTEIGRAHAVTAGGAASTADAEPLYSWVIAPAIKAQA